MSLTIKRTPRNGLFLSTLLSFEIPKELRCGGVRSAGTCRRPWRQAAAANETSDPDNDFSRTRSLFLHNLLLDANTHLLASAVDSQDSLAR